ncbi:MAG: hypothetical protein II821_03040 [Treponema sp.]|nr:hypothetical protein [Treponema sp.]
MKLLKKIGLLALMGAAFAFIACSDSESETNEETNKETDKENKSGERSVNLKTISAGNLITIGDEEYVVLKNTYAPVSTEASVSERAAISNRSISINDKFTDREKKLILHYIDLLDLDEMLKKIGVTEYIQAWSNNVNLYMPYQKGGKIYCSDYFTIFNSDGVKIANLQLNWESSKMLNHLKGNNSKLNNLACVQEFEKMVGLSKSSELAKSRYDYTDIDKATYALFRINQDPNVVKVQSFPENINKDNISEKKYDTYTYTYDSSESDFCHITSYALESATGYDRASDYHYVNVNGKENLYFSHKHSPAMKGTEKTTSYYRLAHANYNTYNVVSEERNEDLTDKPLRNGVSITAEGQGMISEDVISDEYKNKMSLYTFELKHAKADDPTTAIELALCEFDTELTGSTVTPAKYRVRVKSEMYDKNLSFTEQKVMVYEYPYNKSSLKFGDGESLKKDSGISYTLKEAVDSFLNGNVYFSSETVTINDYEIPARIKMRAPYPAGADFNKDFTIVTLIPEEKEYTMDDTTYKAFVYTVEESSSLNGKNVPEFVKKYSDGIADFYAGSYSGADNSFSEN